MRRKKKHTGTYKTKIPLFIKVISVTHVAQKKQIDLNGIRIRKHFVRL